MPDESIGTFSGDGSVRWEVVTTDDDSTQAETLPVGTGRIGRKNVGADKKHGEYFQIDILVPQKDPEKFLAQFTGRPVKTPYGDAIRLYLPVEKVPNQIIVDWGDSVKLPGSVGSL
jgi:hypothetical protein